MARRKNTSRGDYGYHASDVRREFNSVVDFVKYVSGKVTSEHYAVRCDVDSTFRPFDWGETVRAGLNGNPEYTNVLFDAITAFNNGGDTFAAVDVRDVEGQFFDVGDVVNGVPECWFNRANIEPRENIDIVAGLGAPCDTSIEQIVNRGAAIVGMVERLTECGFNVNIELKNRVEYGANYIGELTINIPTNPIDIDGLAFILANPCALRRMIFAWRELETANKSMTWCAYGASMSLLRGWDVVSDNNIVLFDSFSRDMRGSSMEHYSDIDGARAVVANVFKRLNANNERLIIA